MFDNPGEVHAVMVFVIILLVMMTTAHIIASVDQIAPSNLLSTTFSTNFPGAYKALGGNVANTDTAAVAVAVPSTSTDPLVNPGPGIYSAVMAVLTVGVLAAFTGMAVQTKNLQVFNPFRRIV